MIRLKDVCFDYPDGKEALHRINLEVAPGELLALVGANGSVRAIFRPGGGVRPCALDDPAERTGDFGRHGG
jgi:hypothetical protein